MRKMPEHVRRVYALEMTTARETEENAGRWHHLERAHIISQPYPWPHTRNHVAMLGLALRQRDRREAIGQIIRIIVAAPGSALGRYPEGNTGRTKAGLMTVMTISSDLAATLEGSSPRPSQS
ncbi:DUF3703 domain-containing protein [Tomitella biformata]|uniref:DUF3703 domain-containing protein n=1 Tax=Tomitella biformata TaxID=630403 RepID=UPI000466B6F8|nr:DUF3703 domain-containing protein [Tomitella biformata]